MNKNIIIGLLVVVIAGFGGFLVYEKQNNLQQVSNMQASMTNDIDRLPQDAKEYNQDVAASKEYKNTELGISFNYPKELGDITFKNGAGTTGKNFFGYLGCKLGDVFCMHIGGTTGDFTFPGSLNAYEVSSYPSNERLQELSANGYINEKKTNSKGQEYIIIYGKKEVDMPFIGQGQAVVLFKLESSKEFDTLGIMLMSGDFDTFQAIVDSLVIN